MKKEDKYLFLESLVDWINAGDYKYHIYIGVEPRDESIAKESIINNIFRDVERCFFSKNKESLNFISLHEFGDKNNSEWCHYLIRNQVGSFDEITLREFILNQLEKYELKRPVFVKVEDFFSYDEFRLKLLESFEPYRISSQDIDDHIGIYVDEAFRYNTTPWKEYEYKSVGPDDVPF